MNQLGNAMTAAPLAPVQRLEAALAEMPVIAILRGLTCEAALDVVQALYDAGIRVAEIPLNSPHPFQTIALLVKHYGDRMVLGAGTVITVAQVQELAATGAVLCVSPNTNTEVIREAIALGLVPVPGFQTPSEAFAALGAGAQHLKLFPAMARSADLKALMAVLPPACVWAVGGYSAGDIATLKAAGATAFGIGSDMYRPGADAEMVRARAVHWAAAASARGAPTQAGLVCNPGALIGESPVWRSVQERIVWVDPVQSKLMSVAADGAAARQLQLGAQVFALAALPGDQLVGTLADGFCLIDETTGCVERGPVASLAPGLRFNDMVVDADGGLWAGAMHKGLLAAQGALYYARTVGSPCRKVASGLGVPNGMGFAPDGRTLYLIDTLARTLLAYPVDLRDDTLGEPVIITDFLGLPGKPDGLAVAPDGTLWVAMWGGGCAVRIGADGSLMSTIAISAPHVSSVCVDDRGRLWVSTSRMRLSQAQLDAAPGSGGLFMVAL